MGASLIYLLFGVRQGCAPGLLCSLQGLKKYFRPS